MPLLFPHIPHWVQIALFVIAACLLIISLALAYSKKSRRGTSKGITVTMGNGNTVGRIGHSNGE